MSDCHDFCGFWLKGIWWDANRELKESVIGTEVFTRRCRNRVQAADHSYFWVPIIIRYRNHKNAERSAGKSIILEAGALVAHLVARRFRVDCLRSCIAGESDFIPGGKGNSQQLSTSRVGQVPVRQLHA